MNVLALSLLLLSQDLQDEITWPQPTPALVQAIQELGNDSFERREKAHRTLTDLGWPALLAVKHGLLSEDAEIRRRCERIYDGYFDVEPLNGKTYPWIFQLGYSQTVDGHTLMDKSEALDLYWKHYRDRGTLDTRYDDVAAENAMRAYMTLLLHRGWSRTLVQKIIDRSQQNSVQWGVDGN